MISQARLKERLFYDPETGEWTWVMTLPKSKRKPGDRAGSVNSSDGYRYVKVDGVDYRAGRLAWFYMTGEWPKAQIDHENRIKSDDRWINLREATQSQNSFNRTWTEQSGEFRGISAHGQQWAVNIGTWYLGLYRYLEDAKAIRDLALWYKAGPFATLSGEKA